MRYYKLIDPFNVPVTKTLPHKTKNGVIKHEMFTLRPKEKYDEFIDDDVFMGALLDETEKIPYTEDRQKALDDYGAKYEVIRCKSCGGRVKKLKVWFAEVVE